jgi:rubrerythrin
MPSKGGRLPRNSDGTVIYSQSTRAKRERAARLALKEKRERENSRSSIAEEPPALHSPGVSFSTEDIGIATKTRAAPPPEIDTYTCKNCKGTLTKGDPECPICESGPLDWSGVN